MAARYCRQQVDTAAQQLNLHPSAENTAPAQDEGAKGVPMSEASPDAIRDTVREKLANSSSATDQQHSSSVQDASKQQRPQGCESKQGADGSSRDQIMLDVAAEDGSAAVTEAEAGFAAVPSIGKLFCCL